MTADKEIMKAIERLRLDRGGRVYQRSTESITDGLHELATTFREEAELWSRSGAKGWKGKETEGYVIAQAIDTVTAQLDNAGGGAALSVSEPLPRQHADTTHERLDDFVNSAVAAGKGTIRPLPGVVEYSDGTKEYERPPSGDWPREADGSPAPGDASDVAAYLKGETDTLPGLADALVPSSVTDATTPPNDDVTGDGQRAKILAAAGLPELVDLPIGHSVSDNADCVTCSICNEACLPTNPCTCCRTSASDMVIDPAVGPDFTGGEFTATMLELESTRGGTLLHDSTVPPTWESDTMTADGHRPPGLTQAPTLGQPGDMGTGYSHTYVPAGGRAVTFAELLTVVPAASLPPHLSNSQINTVGDCAAKYRMQRVEQLPQIPQWANIGGTAFHAAVEAFERTAMNLPTEKAQAGGWAGYDCEFVWKYHFENTIAAVAATTTVPISVWRSARKGAEGEQWWRVQGPLMLRRYLDARPDEPTSNLPADPNAINGAVDPFQSAIELEITVDVPTPYGPVPFTAKIDRVTNAKQPGPDSPESNWITLVIRDYKTSYDRPTDTTQLGDYANALRLWGVPESVRILGTYFDARRGEWTTPVDLLAAHPFEAFQYRVTTAHAQKLALTTGPTPARPSTYCGGCAVRYACPIMAAKS